jgi:hypothetical protein
MLDKQSTAAITTRTIIIRKRNDKRPLWNGCRSKINRLENFFRVIFPTRDDLIYFLVIF